MKDYAAMSDQQINQLVGCKVGEMKMGKYGACCITSNGEALSIKGGVWQTFDPCNNPADAWPIIVENKLSIYPSAERWGVEGFNADDPFYFDENPLRCAMIVFLMMKEGE